MITYILLASTAISGYDPGVDYDQLNKALNQPGYAVSQGYNTEIDQNTQSETPNQIYQK